MNKNLTKLLQCYRAQCAEETPKPCWLGGKVSLERGINLHGFLLSETGLGESARLLHQALSTQDVKISACNRILKGRQNDSRFDDVISDKSPFNVSLSVDGLTGFKRLRYQICKQKFNIAYPFWELDTIPAKNIEYLSKYNRLWAPSKFIGNMLHGYGFSNVDVVKHPISLPTEEPEFFSQTGPLKILFHFDFDSFPARKNPEAAIYAFKSAFPGKEDVTLTVKVRGKNDLGRRSWLAEQAATDPRIRIVDQLMTRQEVNEMTADHDVFMSLHRSEGLGLGCAEALAAGKAVVATDYGGSTEFINDQTGYPVQWSRIDVGPDDYIPAENSTWADPSVDHAAAVLRTIYDDPLQAREKARKGFENLVENHSFEAAGRRMVNILKEHGLI